MKKYSENNFFEEFIQSFSDRENLNKKFSKKLNHKNSSAKVLAILNKAKNNIFSANNNNLIKNKSNKKLNNINLTQNNKNSKKYSIKACLTLIPEKRNTININFNKNNKNLNSLFRINKKNRINNLKLFPRISNIEKQNQNDISLSNNIKEEYINKKFSNKKNRADSLYEKNKVSKLKISSDDNKSNNKKDIIEYKSPKKFIKKNTFLKLNKHICLLPDEILFNKENCDKNVKLKEDKDNQNHQLLYSQKYQNFIFKIYKADDSLKKSERTKTFQNQNKKKTSKFSIKEYLNDLEPNKYINKLRDKMKNKELPNAQESKNILLHKSKEYIENFIFKSFKIVKNKQDILEKTKEKNKHYISKEKKKIIEEIINEIFSRIKFKRKNIIVKFYKEAQLTSQLINLHIHIKLSIMTHVLRNSERDENIYFINLIKHILYSHKKRSCVRIPKKFGNLVTPFFHRTSTVDEFIQFNNNNIYYLIFCIKFQLFDSETTLSSYKEQNLKFISRKKLPVRKGYMMKEDKNESIIEKDKFRFLTLKERARRMNRINTKKKTIINKIRLTFNSKLENINLSKNIINLRLGNIEDALKSRNSLNLKQLYGFLEKENEIDDKNNNNFYKNIKLNQNEDNINSIKNDNEEIHNRDKVLLFNYFLYYVEFSQYDKLLYWLKKSSKYMDFNYKYKNGDSLLHLCVKNSVPLYIYKFLVSHGLNINIQNDNGDTALHLAAKGHKYKTIDYLIKLGASEYIYNKKRQNCWECF